MQGVWQSWRQFVREVASNFKPELAKRAERRPTLYTGQDPPGLSDAYLKTPRGRPKKSLLHSKKIPMVDLTGPRKPSRKPKARKQPTRSAEAIATSGPHTAEEKLVHRVDPPRPFDIDERYLETPKERRVRVDKASQVAAEVEKKKLRRRFSHTPVSKLRRRLLFSNPGTRSLQEAHRGLLNGTSPALLPRWTWKLQPVLQFDEKNMYLDGLPLVSDEVKRAAIKDLYFNPKEPSTIQPITDKLRDRFANVSRANVRYILRTLETYQRNYRRRLPPKILSRMSLTRPGVILTDMFFPSVKHGWRKFGGCVTLMDAWSRYVGCYAVERKTKGLVKKAMETFMRDFSSHGHLPRMVLMDQGSDLVAAKDVIETYRRPGIKGKMVFYSKVGKPVQLVEQTQAQIQRRMAVFRTSGLTNDPSAILEDISTSINNQRRPGRGNLTPIQLLALSKEEREKVNSMAADKFDSIPEIRGLKPLFIGSRVRVLLMTFKEQVQNKTKGFAPKWSRDIYLVRKKTALQGNPNNYRYHLEGAAEGYFRHELLKIPGRLDDDVVDKHVKDRWKKNKMIVEKPAGVPDSDSDGFDPEYPSDDSRYEGD